MKKYLIYLIIPMLFCVNAKAMNLNSAEAAVCIDAETGSIILENNANKKLGMASTTKIMTAILAIEKGNLKDIVTAGKNAVGVEGTSVYLVEGEKQTLENLVYGLMLESGNDAAVAIAEHISGTVPEFCKLMNEKAKSIGANNTNFTNPHGLYDKNHYTTAYDLALIAAYSMKNETFAKVAKAQSCSMPWPDETKGDKYFKNRNKLLNMYKDCDGVKPGYTPETGRTLVGSATRNGTRYITVTLNCRDDWNLHSQMLDHAFASYKLERLIVKNKPLGTIRVENGKYHETAIVADDDFYINLKANEEKNITYEYNLPSHMNAPLESGKIAGTIMVKKDGKVIKSINIVVRDMVDKKPELFNFLDIFKKKSE